MMGDWESHTWIPVYAGISGLLWATLFSFPITAKSSREVLTFRFSGKEKTAVNFMRVLLGFLSWENFNCLTCLWMCLSSLHKEVVQMWDSFCLLISLGKKHSSKKYSPLISITLKSNKTWDKPSNTQMQLWKALKPRSHRFDQLLNQIITPEMKQRPLWPSFSHWGTTKFFTTSAPAQMTHWENRALIQAPLCALLAWQECAGLGQRAPPPTRLFASLCALTWSKGGEGAEGWGLWCREECGGHGQECSLLAQPWCASGTTSPFIWGLLRLCPWQGAHLKNH